MQIKCNISLEPAESCVPVLRTELFQSIFHKQTHRPVEHIWHSPGHIFAGLKGEKKLVTFDVTSLDYIQGSDSRGCLDVEEPVVTILTKPSTGFIVVLKCGDIEYWTYSHDERWRFGKRLQLVQVSRATVVAICYSLSQHALYWQEQEVAGDGGNVVYNLYKRQLIEGDDVDVKLGPVSCLLTGGRKCSLYPLGHGVACVSSAEGSSISQVFAVCTLTGRVDILAGQRWITLPDLTVHSPLQYKHIVLKSLPYLKQIEELAVKCHTYLPQTQTLVLLTHHGQLVTLPGPGGEEGSSVKSVELDGCDVTGVQGIIKQFGYVGLVFTACIKFYHPETGNAVCQVDTDSEVYVCSLSLIGAPQHFVCTQSGLYALKLEKRAENRTEQALLESGHFQSDALRLSFIDRTQRYTVDESGQLTVDKMRDQWLKGLDLPTSSRLVQTVEPFLTEYWRLEQLLQDCLTKPQDMRSLPGLCVEDEVLRLVEPKCGLSPATRHAQLLLLGEHFPDRVLDTLLSNLEVIEGELSTSQLQRWQNLVSMETSDPALPLLDLMCRLLYVHRPTSLMPFLKCAQRVADQRAVPSAFSRRKPSAGLFERALQCFPEPSCSTDVHTAVCVHAHVFMTSEITGCMLKAIHLLVKYKRWEECVSILQENHTHGRQFALAYQVVMAALVKHNMLGEYGEKVFSLMPSMECIDTVLQKHTKLDHAKENQNVTPKVFVHKQTFIADSSVEKDNKDDGENMNSVNTDVLDAVEGGPGVTVDMVRPYIEQTLKNSVE
ncbi:uncharacterized protein LOC128214221 [Mya arenaria]|uniref:uncharacterized protein LOC128214221 n=1 Tax=Mya arenaria TaxID=6604 RepID=UPI0022E4EFAD|nr:uncharacterized protein LOC128214221 [Mya arenaria]